MLVHRIESALSLHEPVQLYKAVCIFAELPVHKCIFPIIKIRRKIKNQTFKWNKKIRDDNVVGAEMQNFLFGTEISFEMIWNKYNFKMILK